MLPDPLAAFAARMLLIGMSEKTLVLQYYIWQEDTTGRLLLQALHTAAERGVRVRLLLDDNSTSGLDEELAALAAHPNIQVRLFNPFLIRGGAKWLNYLTDFSRLNRRMHNKSFTADNQVTIVGGRNVGDEYFGATEGVLFADLDVLGVGPVVEDVSDDFDSYWASKSAYPIEDIVSTADSGALVALTEAHFGLADEAADVSRYLKAVSESSFMDQFLNQALELEWTTVQMISDDPAKALGKVSQDDLLTSHLARVLKVPQHSVNLVSPYFVPTEAGTVAFRELEASGVEVAVLTNSLNATDIAIVHAGYAKRRKPLLRGGVRLYEMRQLAAPPEPEGLILSISRSGSSLHAKTFSIDGKRVFVGSFNFDPRSANLNTELGFLIDSSAMARRIDSAFETEVPSYAYEVRLDDDDDLYWLEQQGNDLFRHDVEPETHILERLLVHFFALLPIEWLL
ncbi:phospholipase D family protein [Allohahella marinimesophila]|uniref:Phospholipase D family protein n=2 Tax=Allohahella marinimesophila TaxID=1054972 RepID=A0ABP7Q289_9GAMM